MADRDEEPYYGSDMWKEGEDQFLPLRRESKAKMLGAALIGPIAWVITLLAIGYLVHHTRAIHFGLVVTLVAFIVSMVMLPLLYRARNKEEMDYRRRAKGQP